MVWAEALRVCALLAVLALALAGLLTWPLLALFGFVAAGATVAFSVAAPALVPGLVGPAARGAANARIELARTLAFTAEPAAGALLVGWSGAIAAFVASHSRDMPVKVAIDGGAAAHFERGRMLHARRIGQMNLACLNCHEHNAGRRLLAQTISQGHANAYPIYRLEWQALGSLQRRLRAWYSGVRADLPPYNAPDLLDLSLFLAWRGERLAVEAPGVRR